MKQMIQAKQALERHNFPVSIVSNKQQARELVSSMIVEGDRVGAGGSMSLSQCGMLAMLEAREDIDYMPHQLYTDEDEARQEALHAFTSDVYLCSANAITLDGKIISVDGVGNRIANMIYGPKKVLLICGKNKIVEDSRAAYARIEQIAAPANNRRLQTKNPCVENGVCMHCTNASRICNAYVTLAHQRSRRIHIILVDEALGY